MGFYLRPQQFCICCGERWPQKKGLCRRCSKLEEGKRIAAAVERNHVVIRSKVAVPEVRQGPPFREVQLEGRTFAVVWDGDRFETPKDACERFSKTGGV